MARIVLFNKPFGVLSQFTDQAGRQTLADFLDIPGVYAAGRLDRDSEGLLVLTDDGRLQQSLADPRKKTWKTYWAQVEGEIDRAAIQTLRDGLTLNDGPTKPAHAKQIEPPDLWPREPPIRIRKAIPTSWVALRLREGRNRQVRRMTAAVGFPTLRLVRTQVGRWRLGDLQPGQWQLIELPGQHHQERHAPGSAPS